MIRKLFCSMVVMVVALSVAAAADFQGRILKIEDGVITVQKTKGGGGKKKAENDGDPVKYKVAKDAKIVGGKFNADTKKVEDGDDIKDGLKNEIFTKIGEKGQNATFSTTGEGDAERITKIRVFQKKKKDAAN